MKGKKFAALAACVALLWGDVAAAQTTDLQGCPADRSKVSWLLMGRKKLGTSNGTSSYAPTGVTFFGDPVLGIYQADRNSSWLHIRLSRPVETYFTATKRKYAAAAEIEKCGDGYYSCYMKLVDDGHMYSLNSVDFNTYTETIDEDGQPAGPYLLCFYN